ncbi:hypothetical protein [Legionella bononiensis]|uniref:Uncharacterized protein n=1 Tax=Legionella bononiensis TaxID=2793102 RepID=A0ABS1WAM1_9GAMM|nr:hypothetical protein [Legionella bononiensis]MBL7480376.1 hypothetical protein [Legionella bononiensis]MBL7526392.1 hypothetical protein [Legionella bononiensis]MBL7563114.1 hypothetical protein [Legionella bononiensis]
MYRFWMKLNCSCLILLFFVHASNGGIIGKVVFDDNSISYLTEINPLSTPQAYYEQHKDQIDVVPDGVGLQIFFKSGNTRYLLAGPRDHRLLTLNGGKIEHQEFSFARQLQEEFFEETFGVFEILIRRNTLYVRINKQIYPLHFYKDKTLVQYKAGQFAYVTFTAEVRENIDQNMLDSLATQLSPTALYWEQLGSYLFTRFRAAPHDDGFSDYWMQQRESLELVLADLTRQYDFLTQRGQLLITPEQAFEVDQLDQAWDRIRGLSSFAELKNCFQNTVGRYSERAGYYVLDARQVLAAATDSQSVFDIHGQPVADSIFNLETVLVVFSSIFNESSSIN